MINGTLIVQAINFFIGYLLLRFLLLKPVVTAVQEGEQEEIAVRTDIKKAQEALVVREEEKQKEWRKCQQFFMQHVPTIDDPHLFVFKGITGEIRLSDVKEDAIEKLVKTTKQELVNKVDHV